jgi:hypothetical protein
MCVKIVTSNSEVGYDMEIPLESQITNADKVVINYDPQDPSIDKFMNEMKRCTLNGINLDLNLQVFHNDHLAGAKVKRTAEKLSNDMNVNEIIKAMAISFDNADKKLEELYNCIFGEDSVR